MAWIPGGTKAAINLELATLRALYAGKALPSDLLALCYYESDALRGALASGAESPVFGKGTAKMSRGDEVKVCADVAEIRRLRAETGAPIMPGMAGALIGQECWITWADYLLSIETIQGLRKAILEATPAAPSKVRKPRALRLVRQAA